MIGRARTSLVIGLIVVALVVGIAGGVVLDRGVLDVGRVPADSSGQFDLVIEGWNTIRGAYVDQSAATPDRLAYGALSGMVDSLGDVGHSRFLTPELVKQEHRFQQGELEGIGVEVRIREGRIVVVAPIDGSPAQRAGLRTGDVISKVDGRSMEGLNLIDVVAQILGPAGTSVTLTIVSPSGDVRDVTLVRERIDIKSVSWRQLPETTIAHLRLAAFTRGTADELKQALSDIQARGINGIVLDLRSNPGGLLDEAISVASQFLKDGNVLLQKNIRGEVTPVPVRAGGLATDLPMVVLVNEGSASASEIVAGALQDTGRARVIGQTTFGTGTVLREFDLRDGSAILLATQEWLTPNGRSIWRQGLAPDITVALPVTAQPLYPAAEQDMTAAQVEQSGDSQLLEAMRLLRT